MTGIIKKFFVIVWIVLIVVGYFTVFTPWIYWLIMFGWILAICQLKLQSNGSFILAFLFYIISATVTLFDQMIAAEVIMRVSFIGLLIGFVQALVEFKKS